jgi:hypothetical protein
MFENSVLRKIFELRRDELTGGWRNMHNEQLCNLCSSPSTIRMIKSRKMRWTGHIARIGKRRNLPSIDNKGTFPFSRVLLDWLVINDQKLPNWVWPTLYIYCISKRPNRVDVSLSSSEDRNSSSFRNVVYSSYLDDGRNPQTQWFWIQIILRFKLTNGTLFIPMASGCVPLQTPFVTSPSASFLLRKYRNLFPVCLQCIGMH